MLTHLLYIDPGSGSYIIQAIVAGVLGAAFWVKMSWHRVKNFFSGSREKKAEIDEGKKEI